jgi:hypothetical protein
MAFHEVQGGPAPGNKAYCNLYLIDMYKSFAIGTCL